MLSELSRRFSKKPSSSRYTIPIYQGVLFDLDGTLVDSNEFHALAWQAACAREKIPSDLAQIRKWVGMGGDKMIPALTRGRARMNSPMGRRLAREHDNFFRRHGRPWVKAFPGVPSLLEDLCARGLRLAVASSGNRDDVDFLLKQCHLSSYFECRATADEREVKHSKPDPDVIVLALKKLGLAPSEALMVGDTPYDVRAARAARVNAIVWTGGTKRSPALGRVLASSRPP